VEAPLGPGDETEPVDCSGFEGLVDAETLSTTPRDDEPMERLALCMSGAFVASEDVYQRVKTDVAAIRAADSQGAYIQPRWPWSMTKLNVGPQTHELYEAMLDGTYTEWTCANEHYELAEMEFWETIHWVFLHFEGNYRMGLLDDVYEGIEGIDISHPEYGDDGSTISGRIDGEVYHYLFESRGGDCESGCTDGTTWYYRSDAPGVFEFVDEYSWGGDTGLHDGEPPDWYCDYRGCAPTGSCGR